MTKPHEYYMSQALELAQEAADAGEVPEIGRAHV